MQIVWSDLHENLEQNDFKDIWNNFIIAIFYRTQELMAQ